MIPIFAFFFFYLYGDHRDLHSFPSRAATTLVGAPGGHLVAVRGAMKEDMVAIVPSGAKHNVINTGDTDLKLYTIYSPANHPDGTVHVTREEAMAAEEEHHHE